MARGAGCNTVSLGPPSGKTRHIRGKCVTLHTEIGLHIRWHIEDGNMVIDESNVPVTPEVLNMICPPFAAKALGLK